MLLRPARSYRLALSALLLPVVLSASGVAHADDTATCLRTNENSQKLRREKRLKEAVEELKVCSRPSCPGAIQKDCTQWLREVEAILPTLSFTAKDGGGNDLTDVRVTMDGELLLQQLDGSAVPIDPGKHSFTFSHEGEEDQTQQILVSEGDKARKVEVRFGKSNGGNGGTGGDGRHYSPYPFVLGGLGAASLITGVALFVVGKNRFPEECKGSLATGNGGLAECRSENDDTAKRANSAITQSNIGTGLMIGGGVVLAGGITWFLIETFRTPEAKKAEEARRSRGPQVKPVFGLGSVGLQGTF